MQEPGPEVRRIARNALAVPRTASRCCGRPRHGAAYRRRWFLSAEDEGLAHLYAYQAHGRDAPVRVPSSFMVFLRPPPQLVSFGIDYCVRVPFMPHASLPAERCQHVLFMSHSTPHRVVPDLQGSGRGGAGTKKVRRIQCSVRNQCSTRFCPRRRLLLISVRLLLLVHYVAEVAAPARCDNQSCPPLTDIMRTPTAVLHGISVRPPAALERRSRSAFHSAFAQTQKHKFEPSKDNLHHCCEPPNESHY